MSHGYSSVDLSSLASMFPEAGFYDAPEGEPASFAPTAAPVDSYIVGAPNPATTLLRAFEGGAADAPRSAPPESGLFAPSDAMLFDMMGDANAAHYGADPMASFGNYDSFTPHWKAESASSGAANAPADALLQRLADDDQAQRTANRPSPAQEAARARAPRPAKYVPRPFTPHPAR